MIQGGHAEICSNTAMLMNKSHAQLDSSMDLIEGGKKEAWKGKGTEKERDAFSMHADTNCFVTSKRGSSFCEGSSGWKRHEKGVMLRKSLWVNLSS